MMRLFDLRPTKGDIIASICVLLYAAFVYHISYSPFKQCAAFDPVYGKTNIEYRNWYENHLKCEQAEEREIVKTRPLSLKGVFGRIITSEKLIMSQKDVPYQDWFFMVYMAIILIFKWGFNAVWVAVSLDCMLLAFTIFAAGFIHLHFWTLRWSITWWVWFFSYGVLVSKLYGETFDLMVVLLSYYAYMLFIVGLIYGIIMDYLERFRGLR